MGLSQEKEVDVSFTVTVTTFGKPDKVVPEVSLVLCSALYTAFGSGYRAETIEGMPLVYDHLGHDGHDPDHPTALVMGEEVVR